MLRFGQQRPARPCRLRFFDGTLDIAKAKSEIYLFGEARTGFDSARRRTCRRVSGRPPKVISSGLSASIAAMSAGNIVLKPLSREFDLVCGNERAAVVLPVSAVTMSIKRRRCRCVGFGCGFAWTMAEGRKASAISKVALNVKVGIKGATSD